MKAANLWPRPPKSHIINRKPSRIPRCRPVPARNFLEQAGLHHLLQFCACFNAIDRSKQRWLLDDCDALIQLIKTLNCHYSSQLKGMIVLDSKLRHNSWGKLLIFMSYLACHSTYLLVLSLIWSLDLGVWRLVESSTIMSLRYPGTTLAFVAGGTLLTYTAFAINTQDEKKREVRRLLSIWIMLSHGLWEASLTMLSCVALGDSKS